MGTKLHIHNLVVVVLMKNKLLFNLRFLHQRKCTASFNCDVVDVVGPDCMEYD